MIAPCWNCGERVDGEKICALCGKCSECCECKPDDQRDFARERDRIWEEVSAT